MVVLFCFNEGILGGLLNSFKLGAGNQKDQAMIRSLELAALSAILWEGEKLEIVLIIYHTYMMKLP